jgi:hypothetical protein
VTDDDPLTPGEIRRNFTRLENEDRSLAERITRLAAESLPVKLWDAEHRAAIDRQDRHEKSSEADRARIERDADETTRRLEADIAAERRAREKLDEELRKEIKAVRAERNKRAEFTWQKVTGLIVALAAIAGVIVALMGQSRGIH